MRHDVTDAWHEELTDDDGPHLVHRLTRRQKFLRAGGAALAVLVALTVIAAQAGFGDRIGSWWDAYRVWRAPTLSRTTLAPSAMSMLAASDWQSIASPLPVSHLIWYTAAPDDAQTVYACSGGPVDPRTGGVVSGPITLWRTQDGGEHWRALSVVGAYGNWCYISVAQDSPHTISFTTGDDNCSQANIWLSRDGGETWHVSTPLPIGVAHAQSCEAIASVSSRHTFAMEWYALPATDPSAGLGFQSSQFRSDDGGHSWLPLANRANDADSIIGPLADGQTLLATETDDSGPTAGRTTLWQSRDAGKTWSPVANINDTIDVQLLTTPGASDATATLSHPIYFVENRGTPSRLLRIRLSQITGDGHVAAIPPLPIVGATAVRAGITEPLAVTPDGNLLVLGLGPSATVPTDDGYHSELFTQQWLWEWNPRTGQWSVAPQPLASSWPQCSNGCWQAYIASGNVTNDLTLWLRAFDPTGAAQIYRVHLPDL